MTVLHRATLHSRTPSETASIARRLAGAVGTGHTLALIGGLGAGKTVFARAFARALGVRSSIVSPTFIIVSAHPARKRSVRTLYHVDCYRLGSVKDGDLEALAEAVADPRGVCLIEWADRIRDLRKIAKTIKLTTVRFRVTSERQRTLSISGALAGATRERPGSPASPARRVRARRSRT